MEDGESTTLNGTALLLNAKQTKIMISHQLFQQNSPAQERFGHVRMVTALSFIVNSHSAVAQRAGLLELPLGREEKTANARDGGDKQMYAYENTKHETRAVPNYAVSYPSAKIREMRVSVVCMSGCDVRSEDKKQFSFQTGRRTTTFRESCKNRRSIY